jgi:hypothetical protein
VADLAVNSRRLAPKSPQAFRIACSQNRSMPPPDTPLRYFVTETR